jgi:hypothetical protein
VRYIKARLIWKKPTKSDFKKGTLKVTVTPLLLAIETINVILKTLVLRRGNRKCMGIYA